MRTIRNALGGSGIFARAARSTGWTMLGFGSSQLLRLVSNLILTRLLFPEAFGLLALVMVFIVGLTMFSDVGLGPSIMQNKRGDEPAFLNTAWTIQVIRGVCLWLASCAIALPVALFYGEPMLAKLIPVAGLGLLISGFNPTRIETANRHLMLGRVAMLDLASQAISIVTLVALAWMTRSVWALAFATVIGASSKLALMHLFLPGEHNRLQWDQSAASELVHFGKWIFFSTAAGFLIAQADKAILGKYLTLDLLGVYNIGSFLANFPLYLGGAIIARILIPIYRDRPPAASPENFRKLQLMRFVLSASILSLVMVMAFFGTTIVNILYDPRYVTAGAIVVLIACVQAPQQIVGLTYDQAALAAGDSRRFFFVLGIKAAVQTVAFLIGAEFGGLIGALAAQGFAILALYPLVVWLARLHNVWDPLHDAVCAAVGFGGAGLALWLNWPAVSALANVATN